MYNLDELFAKLDQFKKEASDSSTADGKKGNKSAGTRARKLTLEIGKEFKEFRKESVSGNV